MKRALVTGASGFIGRKLCRALVAAGVEVVAVSRHPVDEPGVETLALDLLQDGALAQLPTTIDTLFHLAGLAHVVNDDPQNFQPYHQMNTVLTLALAEWTLTHGVRRFVFASSVKAVAYQPEHRVDEANILGAADPYGQSKWLAEQGLLDMAHEQGLPVSILRPTLVYGSGVKGNLLDMTRAIDKGWFPPLPETRNRRSMVGVDDVVRALLLLAESPAAVGEIFQVTDGQAYSTRRIYEALLAGLDKSTPSGSVPRWLLKAAAAVGDGLSPWIKLPFDRLRYNKLLGSEEYSCAKLCDTLGFEPEGAFEQAVPGIVAAYKQAH